MFPGQSVPFVVQMTCGHTKVTRGQNNIPEGLRVFPKTATCEECGLRRYYRNKAIEKRRAQA